MAKRTKIIFVVNPISGTSDKKHIIDLIPKYMDDVCFEWAIRMTEYRGHAAKLVNEAIEENADVVVAVGGDGTVNEVARSLIHTNVALGIIPCGSGNGLARHLCIPMNADGALRVLSECHIEELDYGIIDQTPFFCTCGIGFDAFISDRFAKAGKRGLLTYIENTLKEGLKYKPDTYEITVDGEKQPPNLPPTLTAPRLCSPVRSMSMSCVPPMTSLIPSSITNAPTKLSAEPSSAPPGDPTRQ